jgi:phosphohistidine phosphatase SixA
MKLYFFRHGRADWPDWTGPDDERPLTRKGRKEVRNVAKHLRELLGRPLILTSPLPRARETAESAAEILGFEACEEKALQPGFDVKKLGPLLKRSTSDGLMLVGHEPDFTEAIEEITGARTKLAKAGLALLEVQTDSLQGRLLWLTSPKFLL